MNLSPFGRRRAVDIFEAPVLAQLDTRVWEALRLWKSGRWEHVDVACPVGLGGSARVHSTPIDRVASIDGQIDELMQDIDILALNADDQITDEFVAMSRLGCVDRESLLWSLLEGGLVLEMARPRWIEAGSHADKNEIMIERGKVCRDASHGRLWKRDGQGQLWIDESSKSWESYVNAAKHWQKEAKSIFSTNLVVMHGDYHWGNIVVDMQDDDSDLVSGARTWDQLLIKKKHIIFKIFTHISEI